ncbi:uncharacterized protein SAMN05444365_104264 [Micromonospora pattaloongensis]|uniref:YncI copper-binding domain-containing protein n=1 Tax=Micromonospora pattaloongensis TaxID=405436 RepID=A0A1H3P0J5_9ACTN|nr:YcnI family protein [Micromonospora pattaloongensis]SDY94664.1 uncharacterized protein SAMN05444365_104264 [Micromonospora pattaloongensis]
MKHPQSPSPSRRRPRGAWPVLALLGGALAGALSFAPPAAADVTVTPGVAVRGDAAKITFELPTERPSAYTTTVQVRFPDAAPIAEVFPMSVPDWAPRIAQRRLDRPIEAIHGMTTSEVVSTITWTRAAPPPATAGEVVRLPVSVGPLPDAERIAFTITQTYSDGAVVRWGEQPDRPAPALSLVPPPQAGHAPADPVAAPSAGADDPDGAGGWALLGAGLAVGVGLAAGGWFLARGRRPAPGPPGDPHPQRRTGDDAVSVADPELDGDGPVAAGRSRWRLREP